MTNEITLYPATEVFNAILSHAFASNIDALKASPADVLADISGIDTHHIDFTVVENDAKTVNIALPFYDFIDDVKAKAISEEDVAEVAGGEALFIIGLTAVLGFSGTMTAIYGGAAAGATTGFAYAFDAALGLNPNKATTEELNAATAEMRERTARMREVNAILQATGWSRTMASA